MNTETKRPTKLPYEKPKLRVIDLVAEEVLGIGCKTGSNQASGINICASGSCRTVGS